MASSKSLIRAGVSLMTRFLNPNPNPANQLLSRSSRTIAPPKFLPSLFIPQSHTTTPLHFQLHVNDDVALNKLSNEGFLYPSGLPYLPFFLPTGTDF
ncbi:hypothetical protein CDL12_05008 [Handroanthus impetiginosus]|uniref:Uncharacterized protein n=1 Tax=Handroanthus impetiginosus TaxID=429701 RepID=A0A2G9HXP2_9LAMI|nr:hypothetical protein CDL12_05008 [Handroanthus impetiginosus]